MSSGRPSSRPGSSSACVDRSSGTFRLYLGIVAHSSCELNDEAHGQRRNDEQHQPTHSRGRSLVTRRTSGLPVSPPDVRFGVRDDRNVTRHWRVSLMLSDMLCGQLFHRHIMHIETVRACAERRCSRMHMQPQTDPSLPFGAQPGGRSAGRLASADCAIQNSGAQLYSRQSRRWPVLAPSREPYALDRRRSHRVDRGCDHPQNAGARQHERQHTRLDERAMAR